MQVIPLNEPGHRGYLVADAGIAVVIDAPLDPATVAGALGPGDRIAAVVETGVPRHRMAGGRLAAETFGVEVFASPGAIRDAAPLTADTGLPLPELRAVPLPGRTPADLIVSGPGLVFVGDLDTHVAVPDAAAALRLSRARGEVAQRHAGNRAYGAAGDRRAEELASLGDPDVVPTLLNEHAVVLTNTGKADMYWADPRFGGDVPSVDRSYLAGRLGTSWAPTVIDLTPEGAGIEGSIRLDPASLATEMGRLSGHRDRKSVV